MLFIFTVIVAYLLGSISFGILICRLKKLPDPRTQGSHNAGATNVLRIAGKQTAIMVLIGDAAKGLLAILIGRVFGFAPAALGFIALAAILGHLFPIYFNFKGGKGVATLLGCLLGLSIWLALIFIIVWLLMAKIFRFSSLAALIAMFATWLASLVIASGYFIPLFFISVVVTIMHRSNIERLIAGNESKIDSTK